MKRIALALILALNFSSAFSSGDQYYDHTTYPSQGSAGSSSAMRAELDLIEAGFGKLPALSVGNASKIVAVDSGGTALEAITTTGTGSGVRATSPTLVTPALGVATATSINKVAITAPASSSTITIADGKTFTASNTLTFAGTDSSTLNIGTGGTLGTAAYTASTDYLSSATPVTVVQGGTGRATSTTAYGLLAAGTTATGAHQTLAAGATTEVLVGGGASALPVWTTATGTGAPVRAGNPIIASPNLTGTVIATQIDFNGTTSGDTVLRGAAIGLGGIVTFPTTASTETLVGKATTDTLTNKTFDTAGTGNSFSINGLAATANTGTGAVVRATSPSLSAASLSGGASFVGSSSGSTLLFAAPVASGTIVLPTASTTLIGEDTTSTLTNKTYDTAGTGNVFKINGTGITAVTGTGSVMLAVSPTTTGTLTAAAITASGAVGTGALTSTTIVGSDATDASSSTTGALKTAGGLGVAKKLYVGTSINAASAALLAAANTGYRVSSTDGTTFSAIMFNTGDSQLTFGTTTNHRVALFTNNSEKIGIAAGGDISTVSITDATSSTAASVMLAGGIAVAKKGFFGTALTSNSTIAIPAGGTAGAGLMVSSTANFGVFFGSGAPTLSAAKGSLYLRSDGSTTNDRMYVNTNGSTTWTAVTTAL